MLVALDPEADLPRLLVLEGLDLVRAELEDGAAAAADEVIVMAAVQFSFEPGFALEDKGLGETGALEKLERTVDGGAADSRGLAPDGQVKVVDRKVLVRGQESADHHIATRTTVQPLSLEMGVEDGDFISKDSLH